ncbi:MAG: KamA family radical SAM protein [Acidobacteriota bacterium]|nr:KamA family radical SAM protein [Acidobacteriota bacterium]
MKDKEWAGSPAASLGEAAQAFGTGVDETTRLAARRFPLRFPERYLELASAEDPNDPIRGIGWPDPEELAPDSDALDDPVGEKSRLEDPLVVRKHADRVILLVTSRCHFYCRFCFRANHRKEPALKEIERAVDSIAALDGVREVILSGGDPLVLSDEALASILGWLGRVPRLQTVRIHTRAPVHDPDRVTERLARTLAEAAPVAPWIVVHASHPRELTEHFDAAASRLHAAGLPLLDQTVLLRGVNADSDTLAELFRGLYSRKIKPLYLHHPDRVAGTGRFRVTVEEGLAIHRALRPSLPGPALPDYVIDLPDGKGKVPVEWFRLVEPGLYRVTHADGAVSEYRDVARSAAPGRFAPR